MPSSFRTAARRALSQSIAAAVLVAFGAALPAQAADVTPASPTLVNYLVGMLEKREQPPKPVGVGMPFAMPMSIETGNAEQQLRSLGARAAAGAPRVAALYATTERNQYELAWTLWDIAPPPAAADLPATIKLWDRASGADRYALLAGIGQLRTPPTLAPLTSAARSSDLHERLLAAVALGFHPGDDDAVVPLLGTLLADDVKVVRTAAANGLRLLGPRAKPAASALIAYLHTRDNIYMATSALANASAQELRPARADLEAIINDPKLTDFQKQPAVNLLVRIEQGDSATPTLPVPAPAR